MNGRSGGGRSASRRPAAVVAYGERGSAQPASVDHADVVGDVLGDYTEGVSRLALPEDRGFAAVAARPDRRVERDAAEVREVVLLGEGAAAAGPEDVVSRPAVRAPEAGHVLDDAEDVGVVLAEHPEPLAGVVDGDLLGRGDDDGPGQGERLEDGQLGVAGARRQVDDQVVERPPLDVLDELREERLEGFQTFKEFMERRLTPAMRTCDAVRDRLETLSRRVTRAGQLLRTRVDIQVEGQNRDLLASMDRRAKLQLRLQETVEGLSLAAITYYAVGLVKYAAEGLIAAGWSLPVDIITGVAIPLIAITGFLGLRQVRKAIQKDAEKE